MYLNPFRLFHFLFRASSRKCNTAMRKNGQHLRLTWDRLSEGERDSECGDVEGDDGEGGGGVSSSERSSGGGCATSAHLTRHLASSCSVGDAAAAALAAAREACEAGGETSGEASGAVATTLGARTARSSSGDRTACRTPSTHTVRTRRGLWADCQRHPGAASSRI